MNNKPCINDNVKIIRKDNSIDNGLIGTVVNIQKLEENIVAYTLIINIPTDNKNISKEVSTYSQVRDGEYEIIKKDNDTILNLENIEFEK